MPVAQAAGSGWHMAQFRCAHACACACGPPGMLRVPACLSSARHLKSLEMPSLDSPGMVSEINIQRLQDCTMSLNNSGVRGHP